MNTIRLQSRRKIAASIGLLICSALSISSVQAQPAVSLYQSARSVPASELPPQARSAPGMAVRTNAHALNAQRIRFELPGRGMQFAERQRRIERADGSLSWLGSMPGQRGSVIALTRRNGVLAGFFNDGHNLFEIMPGKGGEHVVFQVDVAGLPGDGAPLEPDLGAASQSSETPWEPPMVEAEAIVQDLMVVYTPAARSAYESSGSGIEARIISAVEMANQSYANSALGVQLNLVYVGEISYSETGNMNESLTRLRATADGHMDEVHGLRDSHGADLVSLITQDSNYCGLAYRMSSNSTSFASWAFNVVYSDCLPNQTLAHELGHNQGNTHDRANTSSTPYYPYAFGYRRCVMDGNGFITIMSYSCSAAARVAHFSNPDISYNGHVTGIDHDVDPANSADAVRSMANLAPTIAAFRTSTSGTPPVAPDGLAAVSVTETTITLNWNDNASDEDGYHIERSDGGSFVEIASVSANAVSYQDSGLTESSSYSYRVRAYNGSGYSGYSNSVSATTDDASPSQYMDHVAESESYGFGNITGIYSDTWAQDDIEQWVSEVETGGKPANRRSQAEHTWQITVPVASSVTLYMHARADGNLSEDVFRISYSTDGSQFTPLFEVNTSTPQTYVAVLPASTSGNVYVRAEDSDRGKGNRSLETLYVDWLAIRSDSDPGATPPAAPDGLSADGQSGAAELAWNDNSSDETGFRIERSQDNGQTWSEIAATAANSNGFTDSAVSAGQSYVYRVRAFNAAGDSAASNEAAVTISESGTSSIDLQATGYKMKGVQHVTLSWTGATGGGVMQIIRDGQTVGATISAANGTGSHVDAIGNKGGGSYVYQVCEDSSPSVCSDPVTVVF